VQLAGRQTAQAEPAEPAEPVEPVEPAEPGEPAERVRPRAVVPTGLQDLDEKGLLELARACTASQLARTIGGWRAAKGTSRQRRSRQRVTWVTQDDGNIHFTAVLPPEEGAALIAAVQAATDANTDPEPTVGQEIPDDQISELERDQRRQRTRVEALTEIATHYLDSLPEDRSGEDRTTVVIEINAAALAATERDQTETHADIQHSQPEPDQAQPEPDQAQPEPDQAQHDQAEADVEASSKTSNRSRGNVADPITVPTCRVRGGAALEPTDAYRAACDTTLLGIIVNEHSMPLAVGRQQRLITKHQRRALMIRDRHCQYPGCSRTRHLKAHHRISWLAGGPTDLDNLILLCQTHHTRVHEDHLTITICPDPDCTIRWRFTRPDGTTITPMLAGLDTPIPWRPEHNTTIRSAHDHPVTDADTQMRALEEQASRLRTAYQHIHTTKHPDANRVFPIGGGEGFRLTNCVDALFVFTEPHPTTTTTATSTAA